ncbi:hypothetical protein SLE2022_235540 [Rubroshorea leprosula]
MIAAGRVKFNFSSGFVRVFGNRFNVFPLVSNCKALATQNSPNEGKVTDEVVNQVLASVENDPKLSQETCTAYINKLCRAGNLSEAFRLLQSFRDKNVFFPDAYNTLLAAADEKNDIDLSSQIFKDLLVSFRPLSSTFYSHLARAFAKADGCTALLSFVREASELAFPENTVVINRIIFAFAECRQIEKALLIFDHLNSFKCKPDLFTYNIVLDILGRAGRVDQMLHEFASMKETDTGPDLVSYNTLLNNLRRVGRLDMCLVFFREMTDSGVEPDLFTYTAMIEIFGRSGNIEEALRLFSQMKQRKIQPSVYIYRSLTNNLKKVGKMELVTTLFEEMNSSLSDLAIPKKFR